MNKLYFLAIPILMTLTINSIAMVEGEDQFQQEMAPLFFQGYPRLPNTCNVNPMICRSQGSAGPDCCKKQCVNLKTDGVNCGMCGVKCKKTDACCGGWCSDVSSDWMNCGGCGKKCKFMEACCKGSCVNVSSDSKHCGRCGNRCGRGSSCSYGLCGYA